MKKDSKERLFEVMGRLDKTFKPTLNEGFEEIEVGAEEVPAEEPAMGGMEELPAEEPVEEKSPEEKLAELTTKVDELHAMLHGETESGEEEAEVEIEIEPESGEEEAEVEIENLEESELNEDHLKDRKSQEAFICKNDKDCKKEDLKDLSDEEVKKKYEGLEKKMGLDEAKEKIPVAAVAKVGEAK